MKIVILSLCLTALLSGCTTTEIVTEYREVVVKPPVSDLTLCLQPFELPPATYGEAVKRDPIWFASWKECANTFQDGTDSRKKARSIWQDIDVDYLIAETLLNHARDKLDQAYIHTHMELQKKEVLSTYHEWQKSCWYNWLLPISIPETILY